MKRLIASLLLLVSLSAICFADPSVFTPGNANMTGNPNSWTAPQTFSTVTVTGELTTGYGFFHDRGDPSSSDKTAANFTTDDTWRDLDLSSIVPAGTKTISLRLTVRDDAAGSLLAFRKNGNSNGINDGEIYTQVANVYNSADILVACDSNRVIEYKATNTTWTDIYLVVKGWWK